MKKSLAVKSVYTKFLSFCVRSYSTAHHQSPLSPKWKSWHSNFSLQITLSLQQKSSFSTALNDYQKRIASFQRSLSPHLLSLFQFKNTSFQKSVRPYTFSAPSFKMFSKTTFTRNLTPVKKGLGAISALKTGIPSF